MKATPTDTMKPPRKKRTTATPLGKSSTDTLMQFNFKLYRETDGWGLTLCDAKGKPCQPDYRQYTSGVRDALREFNLLVQKEQKYLRWDMGDQGKDGGTVHDPSLRLMELVLRSRLLLDEGGTLLHPQNQESKAMLSIEKIGETQVAVAPVILSFDQILADKQTQGRAKPYPISSELVVVGKNVFHVSDLGSYWNEWYLLTTTVLVQDLHTYLALALSKFPTISLHFEGYSVHTVAPRTASSSLLFKEIDAYGFLHILPLIHLESYPPGFFEDHDITKVVEIDQDEKTLSVGEVVYPRAPDNEFRDLLSLMGKEAKSTVFEEERHFILEPDFAQRFLSLHMQELLSHFVLFQSSVLGKYKVKFVKPKMRLSLGDGIDYFEGKADIDVEGQTFSFTRFLSEYRQNGYIILNDGSKAYPDMRSLNRFERLVHQNSKQDETVRVSFFDIPTLQRDATLSLEGDGGLRAETFYKGFNAIGKSRGSYAIEDGQLRPYQVYGVQWMEYLRDHRMGGCLADEMGLGKTVEVISLLRRTYEGGCKEPTLILVPRSLIYNWQNELQRFAPELNCVLYYGATRDISMIEESTATIVISSYATIRNDIKTLSKKSFSYVILDESQNIKNLETQTTNAVLALKARHRLALSGTPVENNLGDLYSLFRFLNPSFFGTQNEFLRDYMRPIQDKQDKDVLKDLKTRVYPFMLRRVKKNVLKDLPAKTEQVSYVELDENHLAIYNRRREELKTKVTTAVGVGGVGKNTFMILQALTELRRLASVPEADGEFNGISAKRKYLREVVSSITSDGHKCLIFTNFLATVELIGEDLDEMGIGHLTMTGATGDRQSLVQRFQNDPSIGAFVMTLKTGGVGLNLTAADYVFIVDPWWNRAAENQAIDRTHRIGQENPVFCYRLIAKDTIEEKILELQQRKANLVASLLTSDSNAVKSLSEQDIEMLLG
ncbi:MAG TPA: DEAD/DEAH box helicase [Sphaerochaeta sp.]|nr:DEAD/DEAH box helicase [Sphaerochaeta sp.]